MSFLEENFPFLTDFIQGCTQFNSYYEKDPDDPNFQILVKKLKIYEKFLLTIEKLNNEESEILFEKVEKDKDYFSKLILEKKTKLYAFDKEALTQFDNNSFTLNTSSDSSDSESVSSLDDINSQNSDKEDNDDPESVYVNKMFAKSLIEYNIRKELKDIRADKEQEKSV
jgi:hypothetical protein